MSRACFRFSSNTIRFRQRRGSSLSARASRSAPTLRSVANCSSSIFFTVMIRASSAIWTASRATVPIGFLPALPIR